MRNEELGMVVLYQKLTAVATAFDFFLCFIYSRYQICAVRSQIPNS